MESESEHQRNQKAFKDLLKTYGLTHKQAIDLIEIETKEKIGGRTLRSWLADPALSSARSMPNWAITGLQKATKNIKPIEEKWTENSLTWARRAYMINLNQKYNAIYEAIDLHHRFIISGNDKAS